MRLMFGAMQHTQASIWLHDQAVYALHTASQSSLLNAQMALKCTNGRTELMCMHASSWFRSIIVLCLTRRM